MASKPVSTAEDFFAFMNKRHAIHLDREAGKDFPWTDDKILSEYKFTNIFRELDRTTIWFRENVRDKAKDNPLMSTIIFRWFNFIPTGEILLREGLYEDWDSERAVQALRRQPQWVTGAYMISTPPGMNKLEGVCWNIDQLWPIRDELLSIVQKYGTLEQSATWLKAAPNLGAFLSYEIVTDLRHTWVLKDAPDINSWANAGPGAQRGINRMLGQPLNKSLGEDIYLANMVQLLKLSEEYWEYGDDWPLELREIEHSLCEFDKYERVRLGDGPMKARFVPPSKRRGGEEYTAPRRSARGEPVELLIQPSKG